MRVLVTGASGFIGANLARRLLAEGHNVSVILRHPYESWRLVDVISRLRIYKGGIDDLRFVETTFKRAKPQWVFHCAANGAYSFEKDVGTIIRTNVVGVGNLLEAATASGCELFVNSGSSSEYGDFNHPPHETETPKPNSFYSISKLAATELCERFAIERGLRTCTLRLYSAYGPWEDPRRLMPTMCIYASEGILPPLAEPWVVRDFVHIDDVVDAYLSVAQHEVKPGSIYNVGTGKQTSLADLAGLFKEQFAIEQEPVFGSYETRAWDTRCWVADRSLALHDLNWAPKISLQEGVGRFAGWVAEHHDEYVGRAEFLKTLPPAG